MSTFEYYQLHKIGITNPSFLASVTLKSRLRAAQASLAPKKARFDGNIHV